MVMKPNPLISDPRNAPLVQFLDHRSKAHATSVEFVGSRRQRWDPQDDFGAQLSSQAGDLLAEWALWLNHSLAKGLGNSPNREHRSTDIV